METITEKDLINLLNVTRATFYWYCKRKLFPEPLEQRGRYGVVLWDKAEVDRWIEERKTQFAKEVYTRLKEGRAPAKGRDKWSPDRAFTAAGK